VSQTKGIDFEIVVIDSGSFDGSDRILRQVCPNARFIQSETNIGFARANNLAFQETSGEYVLFLNPDTEVVGAAIPTLYANLKRQSKGGLAGARLLNANGTLQTSCIQSNPTILNQLLDSEFLRARWPKSQLWGMAPLFENSAVPSEVDAVSGACLLIKSSTFREVHGFSEDYFMYSEDIDLAHRVRQAGYRNYYVPTATVIHYGGTSTAQAPSAFSTVMMSEATLRFFRRTRGGGYALAYRLGMFVTALARLGLLFMAKMVGNSSSADNELSAQKWRTLLRWSLDRNELIRKYYIPAPEH
jgi:GT2 family glycosyltransferase